MLSLARAPLLRLEHIFCRSATLALVLAPNCTPYVVHASKSLHNGRREVGV